VLWPRKGKEEEKQAGRVSVQALVWGHERAVRADGHDASGRVCSSCACVWWQWLQQLVVSLLLQNLHKAAARSHHHPVASKETPRPQQAQAAGTSMRGRVLVSYA